MNPSPDSMAAWYADQEIANTPRCGRCGHSEYEVGSPILGGICGDCADDLRDQEQADEHDPDRTQ